MSTSPANGTSTNASVNGTNLEETPQNGDHVEVDVNIEEAVGISILGILFFLVLLALLRSQRRERQLLERLAELQD